MKQSRGQTFQRDEYVLNQLKKPKASLLTIFTANPGGKDIRFLPYVHKLYSFAGNEFPAKGFYITFKISIMPKLRMFLPLLIVLYSPYLTANDQTKKSVTINLHFDPDLPIEEQWVYWFYSYENQTELLDSFYYKPSIRTYHLQAPRSRVGGMATEDLIFPKKKRSIRLNIATGDSVSIHVTKHEKVGFGWEVSGSLAHKEYMGYLQTLRKNALRLRGHLEAIKVATDSNLLSSLQDSIDYWQNYIKTKQVALEFLKTSKTPETTLLLLLFIEDAYPESFTDSILDVVKTRFPDNWFIQNRKEIYQRRALPATEQSERASAKYKVLMGYPTPQKQQPLNPKEQTEIDSIKLLTVGDVVDDFTLQGLDGQVRLYDTKTPYILIDFWATWCGPCMREFPNVYEAAKQNSELVSVFAISLDVNEKTWAEFAKQHSAPYFRHGFCGSTGFQAKKMNKMFGVKAIPANVLLDANRRIIAINLRGEALKQKIEELKKNHSK